MTLVSATLLVHLCAGGLLSDYVPQAVHLLDDGHPALAQLPTPGWDAGQLARRAFELRSQLATLEASRPSPAGPIALIVSGSLLTVGGLVFTYLGLVVAALSGSALVLVMGVVGLLVGLGLLATGIALAVVGGVRSAAITRQVDALERQLRALEAAPDPAQPPPQVSGPWPTLRLASL